MMLNKYFSFILLYFSAKSTYFLKKRSNQGKNNRYNGEGRNNRSNGNVEGSYHREKDNNRKSYNSRSNYSAKDFLAIPLLL